MKEPREKKLPFAEEVSCVGTPMRDRMRNGILERLDALVLAATQRKGSQSPGKRKRILSVFLGPDGAGKALAAQVVAQSIDQPLYKIDLAQVVSQYIGETEKNLDRVLTAAERMGAVLLFDEVDELLGRRADPPDTRDRYARLDVTDLLQRVETFDGVAIITANTADRIDPAFLKRCEFVIAFA